MAESKARKRMMADKTKSKIPKTPREKKMWERARQIVAKETGRYKEDEISWGLVNHIYQAEKKANKVATKADVKKTKTSKAVKAYKTEASSKKKAAAKKPPKPRARSAQQKRVTGR